MRLQQLLQFMLLLVGLVLFSSAQLTNGCSGRGRGKTEMYGAPRPAVDTKSADFLLKKMKKQEKDVEVLNSFTAKARISSENDQMSLAANANIIWIRDSIIWVNAKKFGLEALRVLITRDSVIVLNRLEKTCNAESLESLRIRFNLPEGDVFAVLQNIILGLGYFPESDQMKSDIKDERHRLLSESPQYTAEYRIEEGSYLLKNEVFFQKKDNSAVSLLFDRHQKIKESVMPFSFTRQLESFSPDSGKQKVDIELEEVHFNTNPTYKFDIPGHYTRL